MGAEDAPFTVDRAQRSTNYRAKALGRSDVRVQFNRFRDSAQRPLIQIDVNRAPSMSRVEELGGDREAPQIVLRPASLGPGGSAGTGPESSSLPARFCPRFRTTGRNA